MRFFGMTMRIPEVPGYWGNIMFLVAVGKAAVAGAGLAIAAFGLFDIALANAIGEWWRTFQSQYFDTFAGVGAIIGAVFAIVRAVLR